MIRLSHRAVPIRFSIGVGGLQRRYAHFFLLILVGVFSAEAEEFGSIKSVPPPGMIRADLSYFRTEEHPKAVLVLCPGYNGDGAKMIHDRAWEAFARREHLGMIGLQFESPIDLLEQCGGYYRASEGSGKILLDGIHKAFGQELPIYIYGFSGGAHFTTRFVIWTPSRVAGWCALGAGVLDHPLPSKSNPPGIMACGEDDPRLGGALMFFKQGRAAGEPWLWVQVPKTGHAMTAELDNFVRAYFAALLKPSTNADVWVDIDSMAPISVAEAQAAPSLSGWLPNRNLLDSWQLFKAR